MLGIGGQHGWRDPFPLIFASGWFQAVEGGGLSRRRAAARFGVGISTVIAWVRRSRETGSVAPGKMGGHRPRKLTGAWRDWLLERCRERATSPRAGWWPSSGIAVCGRLPRGVGVRARRRADTKKDADRRGSGPPGRRPPARTVDEVPGPDRPLAPGVHRRNLAGAGGFEPPNDGTKNRCLTAWRRPKRAPSSQRRWREQAQMVWSYAPTDGSSRISASSVGEDRPHFRFGGGALADHDQVRCVRRRPDQPPGAVCEHHARAVDRIDPGDLLPRDMRAIRGQVLETRREAFDHRVFFAVRAMGRQGRELSRCAAGRGRDRRGSGSGRDPAVCTTRPRRAFRSHNRARSAER